LTNSEISNFATIVALHDILRRVVADLYYDPDPVAFRDRMAIIERSLVDGLGRRHADFTSPAQEAQISEEAGLIVTKLFASIRHSG
jgi:hypothetical protein